MREFLGDLVGALGVAGELVGGGVVVLGVGEGGGGEVEEGGVEGRVVVARLVVDEAAVVGFELGLQCARWVDGDCFALLVQQQVASSLHVVAG